MTDEPNEHEKLDALHRWGAIGKREYKRRKARLNGEPAAGRGRGLLLGLGLLVVIGGTAAVMAPLWMPASKDTPKGAQGPAPATPQAAPPSEAERIAAAAKLVYGDPTGASVTVPFENQGTDGEQIRYSPRMLVRTSFGTVLLSEGRVEQASHASAGRIGAAYLREGENGFFLDRRYPDAVITGSFGRVADWNSSSDYMAEPVIYAEGGRTWQGYSCTWGSLTLLGKDGPKEIGSFPLSYDDSGAAVDRRPITLRGKITNVVKGKSFDIAYSGNRSFTEHYVLKDGRFQLQGGDSKMDRC